ncbi:hypothetical protein FDV58_37715 [Bradyrhizobium elkanii]|uniref:Uncharacterized protein n=1 Tax=Bradyrhizobium elkanii TaxID=29448 RepID=A0A4V6CVJ2_BRAEL|nr:hypothetical protein [Bradyrhizobium elkanii]TKV73295.1 hypothetical protein FDV58_37715 [Bradyrhizobium elkanii]
MPKAVADNITVFDPSRRLRPIEPLMTVLQVVGEDRRADGKWVTRCAIIQPSAEIVRLKV